MSIIPILAKTKNGVSMFDTIDNSELIEYKKKGWVKTIGATTAPLGFGWYNNGESRFSGKIKTAIAKELK